MRFAGILLVLVVGLLVYKFYFTSGQQAMGPGAPTQTADTIGMKNDLVSIAQAERVFQAEHNTYGSLDDLVTGGAMAIKKTGRRGYSYEAESSTDSFRVIARCTAPVAPGCTNFAIDQTMQLSSIE